MMGIITHRLILILIFMLYCFTLSGGETFISGEITQDIDLSFDDSPVYVTDYLYIEYNATLTVQAGVHMFFAEGVGIDVNGTLIANGTEDDRVVMTSYGNSTFSQENWRLKWSHVRLVRGENQDEGVVLVYLDGRWGKVCVPWSYRQNAVLCRQLGYTGGLFSSTLNSGQEPINIYDVFCNSREESIFHCIRSSYCSSVLQVVCNQPILRNVSKSNNTYWAGVRWLKGEAFEQNQSVLKYTDISLAGVDAYGEAGNPAIYASSTRFPSLFNVNIFECAGSGLELKGVVSDVNVDNVVVRNNLGYGLEMSTMGPISIQNSLFENNTFDGIAIFDVVFNYARLEELCNNNTFINAFETRYLHQLSDQSCIKTFYTKRGYLLKVKILRHDSWVRLSFYDGNDTSVLLQTVYNAQNAVIQSTTNAMTIYYECYWYYYRCYQYFREFNLIIWSEPTSGFHEVRLSTIVNNKGNGLTVHTYLPKLTTTGITVIHNLGSGLQTYGRIDQLNLESSNFSENSFNGISIYEIGTMIINTTYASENKRNGLFLQGPNVFSIHDSVFEENIENGLFINENSYNRLNAYLDGNSFSFNGGSGVSISGIHYGFILNIDENSIKFNKKGAINVNTRYINHIAITGNYISSNVGGYVLSIDGTYWSGSWDTVSITSNIIINNTCERLLFIRVPSHNRNEIIIEGNVMINNNQALRFPNSVSPSSVVFLQAIKVSMKNNTFENPDFMYEVAVPGYQRLSTYVINASLSWWGSTDCLFIKSRILDGETRPLYPILEINPYRADPFTYKLFHQYCMEIGFPFEATETIGGSITSHVILSSVNSPYRVVRDIVVQSDGVLVIEEGVRLLFDYYTGILVRGTLIAKGNATDAIKMEPLFKNITTDVRLSEGSNTWEGILEVFNGDVWGTVCWRSYDYRNRFNDITARIACQQLGFVGFIDYTTISSTRLDVLDTFQCDESIHSNILDCGFKNPLYLCSLYHKVYLTCFPGKWMGIRYTFSHTPSYMTFTDISYTGGDFQEWNINSRSAIQVDLHNHHFSNMNLYNVHQGFVFYISYPSVDPVMNTFISCSSREYAFSVYSSFYYQKHSVIDCFGGVYLSTFSLDDLTDIIHYIDERYFVNFFESEALITIDGLLFLDIKHPGDPHYTRARNVSVQTPNEIAIIVYHPNFYSDDSVIFTDSITGNTLLTLSAKSTETRNIWIKIPSSLLTINFTTRYSYSSTNVGIIFIQINGTHPEMAENSSSKIILDSIDYLHQSYNYYNEYTVKVENLPKKIELIVINCQFMQTHQWSVVYLNDGGRILFESCNFSSSAYYGIEIHGEYEDVTLLNCEFENFNTAIYDNAEYSAKGLVIEECSFRGVWRCVYIYKTNREFNHDTKIYKSSFESFSYGVFVKTRYYSHYYLPNTVIDECDFKHGTHGVRIEINLSNQQTNDSVHIHNSRFQSVKYPVYAEMYFTGGSPSIYDLFYLGVNGCVIEDSDVFLETYMFTEKKNFKLEVLNNTVIYSKKAISITINDKASAIIYELNIVNNIITNNTANSALIDIGRGYPIISTKAVKVDFTNNILQHNSVTSRHFVSGVSCGIVLGIPTAILSGNTFDNFGIDMEICSAHVFTHPDHYIDARFNRWGTANPNKVRQRIFDNEDWNNLIYIMTEPDSKNHLSESSELINCNSSNISGRMNATCHLSLINSPYKVESDITILPNAHLIIDPGVTLRFKEDSGIIILGKLTAIGTTKNRIQFDSINSVDSISTDEHLIRLFEGNSRVEGLLQIFVENEWKLVSGRSFGSNEGEVSCRQLGYTFKHYSRVNVNYNSVWQFSLHCNGRELSLLNCQHYYYSYHYYYNAVRLVCKSQNWGNIQLYTDSTSEISAIKNVDIFNSGKLHDIDGVPSIYTFGPLVPNIENIHIENCTGHAIVFDSTKTIEMNGLTVKRCLSGILSSVFRQTNIFNSYFEDLYLTGVELTSKIPSFFPAQSYYYRGICGTTHSVINPGDQFIIRYDECGDKKCISMFECKRNCTIIATISLHNNGYYNYLNIFDGFYVDPDSYIGPTHDVTILTFTATSNAVTFEFDPHTTSYSYCSSEYRPVEIQISVYEKEYIRSSVTIEDVNMKNVVGPSVTIVDEFIKETIPVDVSISKCTFERCSRTNHSLIYIRNKNGDCSVSQNFFTDNYGGVNIKRSTSNSSISVTHNYFFSTKESGILYVQLPTNSLATISDNHFFYNKPSDRNDVVSLLEGNVRLVNNLFYYNHGRHLIFVFGESSSDGERFIYDNIMIYNTGQRSDETFTILLDDNNNYISKNYIVNPGNEYEVALTSRVTEMVSAKNNYWGVRDLEQVKQRVRDAKTIIGHAIIDQEPFFTSPSDVEFFSSYCQPAYSLEGRRCYSYKPAAVDYYTATSICRAEGNTMHQLVCENCILSYSKSDVRELKQYLRKKNKDYFKTSRIWIFDPYSFKKCKYLEFDYTSGVHITGTANCEERYPTVCERELAIRCPKGCMGNGLCRRKTCYCYSGWTKADCSQFTCPNDCSNHGTCEGPNVCRCKSGWQGSSCTSSYCIRFKDCRSCAKVEGCGWCDSTLTCLPGTSTGPDDGMKCRSWFHNYCFTTGVCSSNIETINCRTTHCNSIRSSTSVGSCQRCIDVQQCFVENPDGCSVWSTDKCPGNLINPDYADLQRKNEVDIDDNVEVINIGRNSTNIYVCPIKNNHKVLLISNKRLPGVDTSDIIISYQGQGIFHTVESVQHLSNHSMFMARVPRLDKVFEYASFNDALTVTPLIDLSDVPDKSFWENAINERLSHPEKGNILLQDVPFMKCLGRKNKPEMSSLHSTFIVVNVDAVNSYNILVDSIMVLNSIGHYIESIIGVVKEENATFIETDIVNCDDETIRSRILTATPLEVLKNTTITCRGGEFDTNGLFITNGTENLEVNATVIGRETFGLVGKVLQYDVQGIYVFIEVLVARDYQEFGDITNNITENRNSPIDIRLTKPTTHNDGGTACNIEPTFQFTPNLRLAFQNDVIKFTQLDASYEGAMETGLHIQCNAETPFDGVFKNQLVGNRASSNYYVTLAELKIPMSIDIKAKYSVTVELPAPVNTSVGVTASGKVSIGTGIRPQEDRLVILPPVVTKANTSSTRKLTSNPLKNNNRTISINGTFTPTVTVTFPAEPVLPFCNNLESILPDWLVNFVGTSKITCSRIDGDSTGNGFQFSSTFNIQTNYTVRICDSVCIEDNYLPYDIPNAHLLYGGLASIDMQTTYNQAYLSSTSYKSINNNLDVHTRECRAQPLLGEPYCNVEQTTDEGVQLRPYCPDGVTIFRPNAYIECPCVCPDATLRNMSRDGSCPCWCECADGSYQTIAPDGSCPCQCKCSDCLTYTIGQSGCECPQIYDICPPCLVGEVQVFRNCICYCVPDDHCGILPTCVIGRQGDHCDRPDCSPCQACSGNGICTSVPNSCQSRCQCNVGWGGVCCDIRQPMRTNGDPHLLTIDGVDYDYYGNGEFWSCRSIENGFGMQARFYESHRSSLTGGVAMKLGKNVFTITTPLVADFDTLPILRLNGELLKVNKDQKLQLPNSTVLLDIQIPFRNSSSTNPTMILAFEYKSGVSVGVEVQFSEKIRRLYLNTLFTPIVSFMHATEGLCGFMDGNPDNDFLGSDGDLYQLTNVTTFVETWKIMQSNPNGGLFDSWSWNSSNFHQEDELDSSYTKSYKPIYSSKELSQDIVEMAEEVCLNKIADKEENAVLIESCIYDIAVTNDTSFVTQQTLQTGCPNQCSGRGLCINDTCECLSGWSGEDCRNGSCIVSCMNGNCVSGFCRCDVGWEGETCEEKATCTGVNNCTDEEHGVCLETDICLCNKGFTGADCSIVPTCLGVSDCTGNGVCVDFDVCDCEKRWKSSACDVLSCHNVDGCSGNGVCISFDVCQCYDGWTGESCALPDCAEMNQCSEQGECIGPNECSCYVGYEGANCTKTVDCSELNDCNGNGVCIKDTSVDNGTFSCECFTGYSGENCTGFSCDSLNGCSGHGTCIEPNLCMCDVGYTGDNCTFPSCESLAFCSGNGRCISFDECECFPPWSGEICDTAYCTDECNGRGDCVAEETCECYLGYEGDRCQDMQQENLNPPIFDYNELNVTFAENSPIGTFLITVYASDNDTGKNGEVSYRILPSEYSNLFQIDRENGNIVTAWVFDFEIQISDISLTIVAEDNGFPPMNAYTTVNITLLDVNDNCPVFIGNYPDVTIHLNTTNGTIISNISVTDEDDGDNGFVSLSMMVNGDMSNSTFMLDFESGELSVVGPLQSGRYFIKVIASDNAQDPCTTKKEFFVYVPYVATYDVTTVMYTTEKLITTQESTTEFDKEITTQQTTHLITTDATTPGITTEPEITTIVTTSGTTPYETTTSKITTDGATTHKATTEQTTPKITEVVTTPDITSEPEITTIVTTSATTQEQTTTSTTTDGATTRKATTEQTTPKITEVVTTPDITSEPEITTIVTTSATTQEQTTTSTTTDGATTRKATTEQDEKITTQQTTPKVTTDVTTPDITTETKISTQTATIDTTSATTIDKSLTSSSQTTRPDNKIPTQQATTPNDVDCVINEDCSNGANCLFGVCACTCPYSGPTCDQVGQCFDTSIRITHIRSISGDREVQFSPELENSSSQQFQDTYTIVTDMIKSVAENSDVLEEIKVIGFREGSILVDMSLVVIDGQSIGEQHLKEEFSRAIAATENNEIAFDFDSIVVTKMNPGNAETDTLAIIIITFTAMFLVILVLFTVVFVISSINKKRARQANLRSMAVSRHGFYNAGMMQDK